MIMSAKNKKVNNSGFTLVEVLIAVVILAIISLPVLSTFSNAARINAKARRTENANTAINNIIEEAKELELEELLDGKGKYSYQQKGNSVNNTYVITDKANNTGEKVGYFTGVDGEKYYVRAKIDPGAYTKTDDPGNNISNDINSQGLSVYADISSGNNYVYRDDNADSDAIKWFNKYGVSIDSSDIKKNTLVEISFEEVHAKPELKIKQVVRVTVTYTYKTAGVYPPYEVITDFEEYVFSPKSYESKGKTLYTVSGKEKNNARNMYIFYMPFKGTHESGSNTHSGTYYTDDTVSIKNTIPVIEDVTFSDINIYMMQQEKIIKDGSEYKTESLKLDNIFIDNVAASVYTGGSAVSVYSNITGWNDKLKEATNNKNVLYRMTVDVWLWRDVEKDSNVIDKGDEPSATKIASITTTKED